MTVTKRKQTVLNPAEQRLPAGDTGVRFTCDCCSADISHTVRIRCAQTISKPLPQLAAHSNGFHSLDSQDEQQLHSTEVQVPTCEDFDLCGTCFIQGKEVGRHKRWHDYRVVEPHAYPIFDNAWGADEELLLIDACLLYGLGNWADIAEHIGSFRTKEEVAAHYVATYTNPASYPEPHVSEDLDADQERFQSRKRQRLEEAQSRPMVPPVPKPAASVPSCHEVGGFMPGRLEFEHEYENEAETLIKDMEFGLVMRFGGDEQPSRPPDDISKPKREEPQSAEREAEGKEPPPPEEDDEDLDLKLTILEIYNERYDRRVDSKNFIFDRALTNYKQIQINEKKRTKEERDLMGRIKVFARVQTSNDYENFADGLLYELTLRKRIAELQEYRRAGLTSFVEIDKFEKDRASRSAKMRGDFVRGPRSALASSVSREGTPKLGSIRRPNYQLTLATASAFNLLTDSEKSLCSQLRIMPKPYLFIKQTIIREYARRSGHLSRRDARAMFRIDPTKVNRIFDSLLRPSSRAVTNGHPAASDEQQEEPTVKQEETAMQID